MNGKIVEIIVRTSTTANQPRVSINAAGKDCQVSIRHSLGRGEGYSTEDVVFTGEDFSREEFERQGGVKNEEIHQLAPTPSEMIEKLVIEAEQPPKRPRRLTQVNAAEELGRYVHGNQKYGDRPYTYHLEHVCRTLTRFGFIEMDNPDLHAAAWLHDASEDQECPPILIEHTCGWEVAKLVWCVTDGPGKNRRERHAKTYLKIKANRRSVVLKLADRIANVVNSIEMGGSLLKMYRKEYREFKKALYLPDEPEMAAMWTELDTLLGEKP